MPISVSIVFLFVMPKLFNSMVIPTFLRHNFSWMIVLQHLALTLYFLWLFRFVSYRQKNYQFNFDLFCHSMHFVHWQCILSIDNGRDHCDKNIIFLLRCFLCSIFFWILMCLLSLPSLKLDALVLLLWLVLSP